MSQAVSIITDQVRARVRRDGVDLSTDSALADRYVRDEVRRYSERALGGAVPLLADEGHATRQILATLTGYGPIQPYFDDAEIEEIWINAPDRVFVARDGIPELTSLHLSDVEVRDLVERMLQSSGRRVDLSSPFVDASLPDGSRLHVVIPDAVSRSLQGTLPSRSKSENNSEMAEDRRSITLPTTGSYHKIYWIDGKNPVDWSTHRIGDANMWMQPDLTNSYSRKAVQLWAEEQPLGYMADSIAAYYQPELLRLAYAGIDLWCAGRVISHGRHDALYEFLPKGSLERWVDKQLGRRGER